MPNSTNIPYFDLTHQFANYRTAWLEEIERLGQTGNFILGSAVNKLESELAEYLGVNHVVTVANGTDAIVIALRAFGVGSGDTVIVPNFTFYASVEAISLVGAKPRLVDICQDDFNIDPKKIREAVDDHVKAILPVHLFGLPANMKEINSIGEEYGIPVIEDVAQAFGSVYSDAFGGNIGDFGCFSFYPTKVLGAYGDGGMITTNCEEYAEKVRLLRNHGITGPNQHELIGCTSRLDAVQAVLLSLKLKSVSQVIKRRRELADRYRQLLQDCPVELPKDLPDRKHVFNIFTIRSPERNKIADALQSHKIGYQIYYPMPIHNQTPYQGLGYSDEEFPKTMQACRDVLSLPLYPEMPDQHVDRICEVVCATLD